MSTTRHRILPGILALWGVASAQTAGPPLVPVTAVRYSSTGAITRVAVELGSGIQYKTGGLARPDRLFIDLADAKLKLGRKGMYSVEVGGTLVRQIRLAQKSTRVVRIVLDLEGPFAYEISQLSSPNRIIIEVRAPGTRTPEPPATQSRQSVERPPEAPPPAEPAKPEPEPVKPEPAKPELVIPPSSNEPANPAKAARPNERGSRTLIRALGLKLGKVVLDPGHGGHDHGTTGPSGLTEKELVLDVALRLGALLEQRMGSDVAYTRSTDVFVPLEERSAIANRGHADLFLSIHANSSPLRTVSGADVYYLNFTSSKEAMDTAARENASHGKSIFELRELIQKIALKDRVDESRELATHLEDSLSTTWTKMNAASRNRGVKKAPFVVLIGASMPAVLSEIGFLSNLRDEALLKTPEHRQRLAESLFSGIQSYAATLSQAQTAAAPTRD